MQCGSSRDSTSAGTRLVADPFLPFKGLERPFVILGHAREYDRRMHIAITRATSRLIVIAIEQDRVADARLARLRS